MPPGDPPRRRGSFRQRNSSRGTLNRRHGHCLPPTPSPATGNSGCSAASSTSASSPSSSP
jgi:hypothetical protein